MQYYPIYVNLDGQRCIVGGGGKHAGAKAQGLLDAGALVTVIARDLSEELTRLYEAGRISWVARDYRTGDLAGAFLVISTLFDPVVNRQIWQEATERCILVNATDDIPHCNFIAPAVVRQGDLTFAISTSGKSPALAVRLRQQLEQTFGPEYGRFLELAGSIREALAQRYPDFETRRARWYELVDSDVIDLLRQGDERQVRRRVAEILDIVPEAIDEPAHTERIRT